MRNYDLIVIGSGSGMNVVNQGLAHGLKVALIEKDLLGGTCLNVGCIPSKMLIYPADVIAQIKDSAKLGVKAEVKSVDFNKIMNNMRQSIKKSREHMEDGINQPENLDYYHEKAEFKSDYTIKAGSEELRSNKIVIAAGARPFIPPIKGVEKVKYLTNESLLELKKKPKSLIIIGGGYIGCEYAHFFSSIGTKVTVIQRNKYLVPNEEPGVSELLAKMMKRRMEVHTNTKATELKEESGLIKAVTDGKIFRAEQLLMAVGRRPNSDLLKVEKTGVEVDDKGFIKVNDYYETSREGIYALGDITGRAMFKHVANLEASYISGNLFHDKKQSIDYSKIPHAVFSHPQIAGVGLTEAEARENHQLLVGKAGYDSVAKGEAMMAQGFAKAIVDKDTNKILGFHIIGKYAPILIQEVINLMAQDLEYHEIDKGMHIHPALPELIISALSSLEG
ncbi:dihydrolipoyl dehydrogenase [archaeon]|nr:dihydrolipoyl dehydrogenase [archaeon]